MVFNMVVLNNIKLHMVLKWSIPVPIASSQIHGPGANMA